MQQLAITNDWLPIDKWIADKLDKSAADSQLESDLVDSLLFWAAKHSIKGTSSRNSLAKSLEGVRILVSLGIDDHIDGLKVGDSFQPRLRDFFKAPFQRLKTLDSSIRIEEILNVNGPLSSYWKSETNERIDKRLYSMVRKNYESKIEAAVVKKELLSILKRLIRTTTIPCHIIEDKSEEEIYLLIKTIIAMHLNRIKRPTKRRDLTKTDFNEFEPLSKEELKKVRANGSLTGNHKTLIDDKLIELFQRLDVDEKAIRKICFGYTRSWTDYISGLCVIAEDNSEKSKKESEGKASEFRSAQEYFADNFIVDESFEEWEIKKNHEDEDMISALKSIFTEHGFEYSRKELDIARGVMPQKELDSILRKAEKKGFILVRKEGRGKLYSLAPPVIS